MPVSRLEALLDSIASLTGWNNPDSEAYQLRNPILCRNFSRPGKTILTAEGPSKVVSVSREPEQRAYNVVTDGSHTYRADGVWALGQSDGERQVAAATWQKINKKQAVEEGVYVR